MRASSGRPLSPAAATATPPGSRSSTASGRRCAPRSRPGSIRRISRPTEPNAAAWRASDQTQHERLPPCCHCEGRSDEAISVQVAIKGARLLRSARNDAIKPPSLTLLAAVTALGFCALHMVVPALPLLVTAFNDSPARVQLVLTLYLAGIAGGQLVYGPMSDRFGRRPVLIAGLMVFLLGTLLCGLAWSLAALIFGRVLEAFGACAGIVLGRAIIRDVYEREAATRGLAIVMMAMSLAPAISPAIGAYLAEWVDWRAIFALLGILGGVVLLLTAARLGETNLHPVRLHFAG